METNKRLYLNVPFREKDQAKDLGARWDGWQRAWYIFPSTKKEPFARWLPAKELIATVKNQAALNGKPLRLLDRLQNVLNGSRFIVSNSGRRVIHI